MCKSQSGEIGMAGLLDFEDKRCVPASRQLLSYAGGHGQAIYIEK